MNKSQIKQIAREYKTKGATSLAKEFGVSKQSIQSMTVKLRARGVIIPEFIKTEIDDAVLELRIENPELFKK